MAQNRIIEMTSNEIKGCEILKMGEEKIITQKAGPQQIRVSDRHFRRFLRRYKREGPAGMISGHRCFLP